MANNLRVVAINQAKYATITTSTSTVATLPIGNIKTDFKTEVWRTNNIKTNVNINLTWTSGKIVSLVALPFCNFSSTATMRVQMYSDSAWTTSVHDSGSNLCCGYVDFSEFDWGGEELGVNAFSYGGGTYARLWLPVNTVQSIRITISDSANNQAYLESGCIVVGKYWEPTKNPAYGAYSGIKDLSVTKRTDAGDSITQRGSKHKTVNMNMKEMDATDRRHLSDIIKSSGTMNPIFLSLYPDADPTFVDSEAVALEQDNQIYGKMAKLNNMATTYYNNYSSSITLEEI